MARREHPLHSMSSYLGGFPPAIPRRLLEKWVPQRAALLDPFCGSGTTLVEAKLLRRPSVGVDLNPLAITLTQAKLQSVDLADVLCRLTSLATEFRGEAEMDDIPEALVPIFHRRTLAQLCFLRRTLRNDSPEDLFLRGSTLGIMHGKSRRNGSTAYLSVDMPNTFSMSPAYVRRFVEEHGLRPPPVDVFSKLRERCGWLLRAGALPPSPKSTVLQGDAAQLDALLEGAGFTSVGAIVTSPPYLGVLRYGTFNWIRLWFLGYEQYGVDRALAGTDSLDVYLSFMASFLSAASRVLRPGGVVALVMGDVVENGQHLALAERVWAEMKGLTPFELLALEIDAYDEHTKTTRLWGEYRKGRATPMDRVIVLRRIPSRRPRMHQAKVLAQQRHAASGASRRK